MLDDQERHVLAVCERELAREEPHLDDRLRRHSLSAPARTRRALPGWVSASILLSVLVLLLVLPALVRTDAPTATTACGPAVPGGPDRCAVGPAAPGPDVSPAALPRR